MANEFKLLPAPTEFWGLRRLVYCTLGGGALGVIAFMVVSKGGTDLGPADTLASVTLAALVLGLIAGLILGVLIRWVWNRRARRRLAGDLQSGWWPAIRPLVFGIGACFTLVALAYQIENWRGARAWAAVQAEMTAKGERFDLASLVPTPVPESENFAQTPLFKRAYTLVERRLPSGAVRHQLDSSPEAEAARARLSAIRLPKPELSAAEVEAKSKRKPGRELSGRTALADYVTGLRNSTNHTLPKEPGQPAADLLLALKPFEADLAEISQAARRPHALFDSHAEDLFDALIPHLAPLKGIASTLTIRGLARLQARDSQGAFADLRTTVRLSEVLQSENYLISLLVRFAIQAIALNGIAEAQAEHAWTEVEWAELQRAFTSPNYRDGLLKALRTERTAALLTMNLCRRDPHVLDNLGDPNAPGQSTSSRWTGHLLLPDGWILMNMVTYARYLQGLIDAVVTVPNHEAVPMGSLKHLRPLEAIKSAGPKPYTFFFNLLAPALDRVFSKVNRAEAMRELGRVACALEQHRLRHQVYPESLQALVPSLLPALPLDPGNGQPFHYRRRDDGLFSLYSVGENGKDDQGVGRPAGGKSGSAGDELDWVWPLPTGAGPASVNP